MFAVHALRSVFPIADVAENERTYFGVAVGFFVSKLSTSFAGGKYLLRVAIVAGMTDFLATVTNRVVNVDGVGRGGSWCQGRIVSVFEFWIKGTDGRPRDTFSYR